MSRTATLDPEVDFVEIYRHLSTVEFPWDLNQALSLALFRTYAVPSIGRLLDETGEFTGACQKRYDDTTLLLEAPLMHGFDSPQGRMGVRRVNQMHGMYDISNDDLRYVLATFVVVPKRWLDEFGKRPLTDGETRASVNYYRELARHMAIRDVPETYEEFADLMDGYEREHFAFDEGARRVADATLALLIGFYPAPAAKAVHLFSRSLMDPPLLEAFRYDEPGRVARGVTTAAMRVRARALALWPTKRKPTYSFDTARVRTRSTEPGVDDLAAMGSFKPAVPGCPVPH